MPNILKKVTKHCSDVLAADETFHTATFVQPAGSVGKQVALGAIGGIAGALVANKMAAKRQETDAPLGVAEDLPTDRSHVALTNRRVLFFKHGSMSGNPKELCAELPLDTLVDMTMEKGKLSHFMTMKFADGSATSYDVVRGAQADDFIDGFNLLKGRAASAN
ncbi:MAG: hypothetical protein HKN93_00375 [Acidimicrobiia bacterium]|nr:hypothetical protein [Acidimicrobiia bacterium]